MNIRTRRARVAATALCACVAALTACSHGTGGNRQPVPPRDQAVSRPLEIYRDLGFKAGPPQFPAIASLATMAGPGDSTLVMLQLSLPSSALRFERTPSGFNAEYSISLAFMQDTVSVRRMDEKERVTVATFTETTRTDESVVYQKGISVKPGRYVVQLQASDVNSARGFKTIDTLDIPAYGANATRVGSPVFVYSAQGRNTRSAAPVLISNPRHTVAYGGESPKVYVEAYGVTETQPVKVSVVNEQGASVWSADATLPKGNDSLRYGVLDLPSEKLPLGRMWVEVSAAGSAATRSPLLLSISDQWMVTNFDEVLDYLRYIAYQDELDSLKSGTPEQRRSAWESFWSKRDPLPATPANEFRDQFFQRVRYATDTFHEPGLLGWKTERGEVYIVLGPPDHSQQRWVGNVDPNGPPNALEWNYEKAPGGTLNLLFIDRGFFGRYELEPSSASAFKATEDRVKPGRAK